MVHLWRSTLILIPGHLMPNIFASIFFLVLSSLQIEQFLTCIKALRKHTIRHFIFIIFVLFSVSLHSQTMYRINLTTFTLLLVLAVGSLMSESLHPSDGKKTMTIFISSRLKHFLVTGQQQGETFPCTRHL